MDMVFIVYNLALLDCVKLGVAVLFIDEGFIWSLISVTTNGAGEEMC